MTKRLLEPDQRVRFSAEFCRNTGQITGDVPFRRGKVVSVETRDDYQMVDVQWDDGHRQKVLSSNLWPEGVWEPN
jgi:hypothetical protein